MKKVLLLLLVIVTFSCDTPMVQPSPVFLNSLSSPSDFIVNYKVQGNGTMSFDKIAYVGNGASYIEVEEDDITFPSWSRGLSLEKGIKAVVRVSGVARKGTVTLSIKAQSGDLEIETSKELELESTTFTFSDTLLLE